MIVEEILQLFYYRTVIVVLKFIDNCILFYNEVYIVDILMLSDSVNTSYKLLLFLIIINNT